MKKKFLVSLCTILMFLGMIGVANAITIAGYDFDDNAFADTLISSSGSYTTSGGSLEEVLTDINVNTYAYSWDNGAYVELGFEDNYLVNGTGDDLALFEMGNIEDYFEVSITIGGTTNWYQSFDTGYDSGMWNIDVAFIDLDDFGIGSGAYLSSIVIGLDDSGMQPEARPSLSLVGALNSTSSVPEPATLLLLGTGLLGLAGLRRKKFFKK